MRVLPFLLLWVVACGPSHADTTAPDNRTAGGFEMRDRSTGPSAELGRLEVAGNRSPAVSTERSEGESAPDVDPTDPRLRGDRELPLTPSQADRDRVFRRLRPDIELCLRGTHPTFTIRLRVAGSGAVRQALVEGEHIEGTERAECIEAAFRDTFFPEFRDEETTMSHRYRF